MQALRPDEILVTEPGSYAVEHTRHRQFADLREFGEWFRMEPPLMDFIEGLRTN